MVVNSTLEAEGWILRVESRTCAREDLDLEATRDLEQWIAGPRDLRARERGERENCRVGISA